MKNNICKKLLYLVCGVMTCGTAFTSCELEPYEIPPEEMYLRNFLMKYGLIDDTQDWNMSTASQVTVVPAAKINKLNVLVECGVDTYRVAEYADVSSTTVIPIDIPDGTGRVIVEADGNTVITEPGGVADFTKVTSRADSRALINQGWENSATTAATYSLPYWQASEEYIDVVKYGWGSNARIGDWQPLEEGETFDANSANYGVVDNPSYNASEEGSQQQIQVRFQNRRSVGSTHAGSKLVLKIHNNTKQAYKLTFNTGMRDGEAKLQVFLVNRSGDKFLAREFTANTTEDFLLTNVSHPAQAHMFITEVLPEGDYQLIVYAESTTQEWSFAGNWGDFKMVPHSYDNMAWLMVCEDLGATDDFDFNDMIIRVECITVNTKIYNQQWQVVTDDSQHPVLGAPRRDADSRANSESAYKRIRVTAMCAGGTLPLYLHFYDTKDNKDYIIGHGKNNSTIKNEASLTETSDSYFNNCEWHKWFGIDDHRIMINTGTNRYTEVETTTVSPDQLVPVEFYVGADFKMSQYSKFVDYDSYLAAILKDEQIDESWNWAQNPNSYIIQGFYVTVGGPTLAKCRSTLYAPQPGKAPQMFLIPDIGARGKGWDWPSERTDITDVYPFFSLWAKSGGETDNEVVHKWYMTMGDNLDSSDYCPRE